MMIQYLVNIKTLKINWVGIWDNKCFDISPLKNIYNLTLSNANIKNIDSLKNVHTLHLNNLGVVDISKLTNIYTLTISHMNISDVSMLGAIHNLTLIRCNNITDVSKLGTVKNLILLSCDNIRDVSNLKTVRKLIINNCINIQLDGLIDLNKRNTDTFTIQRMPFYSLYVSIIYNEYDKIPHIHVKVSNDYKTYYKKRKICQLS
jgi:hypothetical protein